MFYEYIFIHLNLYLKIPKPGEDKIVMATAHVVDELRTSLCPTTMAISFRDSPILLG